MVRQAVPSGTRHRSCSPTFVRVNVEPCERMECAILCTNDKTRSPWQVFERALYRFLICCLRTAIVAPLALPCKACLVAVCG
jgi:hypothetical protein